MQLLTEYVVRMALPGGPGMRGYDVFKFDGKAFAVLVIHESSFLALPLDQAQIRELTQSNFLGNITSEYLGKIDLDQTVEFSGPAPRVEPLRNIG